MEKFLHIIYFQNSIRGRGFLWGKWVLEKRNGPKPRLELSRKTVNLGQEVGPKAPRQLRLAALLVPPTRQLQLSGL